METMTAIQPPPRRARGRPRNGAEPKPMTKTSAIRAAWKALGPIGGHPLNQGVSMTRPVLVTTLHRGVFFGHFDGDENDKTVVLTQCRNAIYWSGSKGFLGLAAHGPESGSKIGSTAARVLLHDVTSISDCTLEAQKKWEEWP